MLPLINVIIPIYNMERYLFRCVNSIVKQTYPNLQIILVDDGSTDSSATICNELASNDKRITVLNKGNGGISSARNLGLSYIFDYATTKGEYIAFVDSDDCVMPDYIEFLYKLLINHNADIAQCGHYIVYSKTRKVEKNKNHRTIVFNRMQALESLCYNDVYDVTVWNKLYKIDVFKNLRFTEERIYEDTVISYRIAENASIFVANMQPKYYYIQRYDSIANGTVFSESKYQFINAGDEMADYISLRYPTLCKAANVKRVFVRLSTLSQMVNSNYYDHKQMKEMKKVIRKHGPSSLINRKVSKRDKLGVIVILFGYPCYRFVWRIYYKIIRRP